SYAVSRDRDGASISQRRAALYWLQVGHETNVAVAADHGYSRRALLYAHSLAQLALAAALLAALLWRVDLTSARTDLSDATLWWLPLAFVANLTSDWLRAIRWHQFLAPMKHLSIPFLFAVAVLGVACNLALPLRAGEV